MLQVHQNVCMFIKQQNGLQYKKHFLTIAVFQLNQQDVFVNEVVVIRYDVVMLENGQDADFIHDISALFIWETSQLNLLPYHQGIILRKGESE